MSLKPLKATKEIQQEYVDFYKSNFALDNEKLAEKLDGLKENNRLWKSPFVLISQNYVYGKKFYELINDTGIDEDVLKAVGIERFFIHQEKAITNIIKNERDTIISSGTGSGKTESFLIPILDNCAKSEVEGIKAIIVYPMNALAGDQVTRLRKYLFNLNNMRNKKGLRKITFGIYNGATPNTAYQDNKLDPKLSDIQLPCPDCGRNSLSCKKGLDSKCTLYCTRDPDIDLDFQLLTRNDLRKNPPDILVTSYVMLDRILLRPVDKKLFQNNKVKFLVLDEMHTYAGARGADVALMIRRLKRRLDLDSIEKLNLRCIGTSATMSKSRSPIERQKEIAKFATNLFGTTFTANDVFEGKREKWQFTEPVLLENYEKLNILDSLESNFEEKHFVDLCKQIDPNTIQIPNQNKKKFLGKLLLKNEFFQLLTQSIDEPRSINEITNSLKQNSQINDKLDFGNLPSVEATIWSYLQAGSIAENPKHSINEPLLRVSVHNFFRVLPSIFLCTNPKCQKMFFVNKDKCDLCEKKVEELAVCRNCSREFYITKVSKDALEKETIIPERQRIERKYSNFSNIEESKPIKRFSYNDNVEEIEELWYSTITQTDEEQENEEDEFDYKNRRYKKCLDCGSFSPFSSASCMNQTDSTLCNSSNLISIETYPPKSEATTTWRPRDCPFCHYSYGNGWAITQFQMAEKQATVNLFNMIFDHIDNKKLLIFTDSRQDAAELAGWIDFAHEDTAIKQLMVQKLIQICKEEKNPIGFDRFQEIIINAIEEEWYNFDLFQYDRDRDEFKTKLLLEISSKLRLSLERIGLIEYNYRELNSPTQFLTMWKSLLSTILPQRNISINIQNILNGQSTISTELDKFIITILHMMRREQAAQGLENRTGESRTYAHGFHLDNSGKSFPIEYGIKIHNLVRTNNKFIKYTKKVFNLESNDEATYILETVWNFLQKRGFIIPRSLRKYRGQTKMGYVVSTNKLLLSTPKIIQKCLKCKSIYTNLPNNSCAHYSRQKICTNQTTEMTFDDFSNDVENSHFFRTFKEGHPSRMSVREHTGAIPEKERDKIQTQFLPYEQNKRDIDVVVATPTLELGIDIGDLSTICLYKAPPSPASYIQRVGRAGRRDGISFINTFFFNSPIDEFYYQNPQDLIKGNFNPPPLKIENNDLLIRHLHSLILEHLTFSEESDFLSKSVEVFLNKRIKNTEKIYYEIENKQNEIFGSIRQFIDGLNIIDSSDITNQLPEILSKFKSEFDDALDYFVKELTACKNSIRQFEQKSDRDKFDSYNIKQLYEKLKNLQDKTLENHLFDVNFLPRFAFPGLSVTIEDTDGNQMHGGRSRQIAISEFAPKCEITYRKKKYESIGVDLTNVEHGNFFICNRCMKYYTIQIPHNQTCPYCNQTIDNPKPLSSIAPKKIYIQKTKKSLNESGGYREAKIDTFLSDPKIDYEEKTVPDLGQYSINLKKFGNIRLLLTVNGLYTTYGDPEELDSRESQEIQICNKCGKVKDSNKQQHYPLNKKFARRREFCSGNFNELKSLHHVMPTNVISVKITKKTDSSQALPSKKFLTTLKNAIIFAGQIICESVEGEIGGIVKENEILFYDNVDGGAGYVDIIYDRFEEVLKRANKIIEEEYETYQETCDHGCLRCLWSYRNKRDIKLIDKRLISPLLQESIHLSTNFDTKKKLKFEKEIDFEKIISKPLDIKIVQEIKNHFRSANKKILIYTPIISKNKIEFLDEGLKQWSEILGSIRTGEKSIAISIVLKKLELVDQKILRKLIEDGIDIFILKDEFLEQNSDNIGTTQILIDPYEESRNAIEVSSGLTEKLWREFSTLRLSKSDLFLESIKEFFNEVVNNSRKVSLNDLSKLENVENIPIQLYNKKSLQEAVNNFNIHLNSAKYEIRLFDPYMQNKFGDENLQYYLRYLCKFLSKDVSIKIITCGHTLGDVQKSKSFISSQGYDLDIISYELPSRPIHRRFILIDGKTSIHLDKGLRFLFEYEHFGQTKTETNIVVHSNKSTIGEDNAVFGRFWNYDDSTDNKIKNWKKYDTRKLN